MSIIEELIKNKTIDKKQASSLEYEAKVSGKNIEELIMEKGIMLEKELFEMKGKSLGMPVKTELPEDISPEVLELLPQESVKYYSMVPLKRKGDTLEVGMVYPEDLKTREAIKFLSRQGKFNYEIFLITPTVFNELTKHYKTLKREVGQALEELETEINIEDTKINPTGPAQKEDFAKMAEEAPITRVVAVILKHAVEGKASDIHIEPTKKELRVRFRIDGILQTNLLLPLRIHPAVIARIKILSNLKIDETRIPQDGRFSTKIAAKEVDFRVSTFPTTLGEKAVLRVLDASEGVKGFEDLGLERRNYEVLNKAIKRPYGMILSTGPTGSGKTTTLYAVLKLLNKEGVNIITLEDPVEYFVAGISQSQVRPEIGYTFAQGLRHILRQDPDIIMVGEIRDEETAALAAHAALTGHIVLSTLHTNNALGVAPRLIDLNVAPFLLPSALSIAIGQRLVRVLCPHCKKKVKADDRAKEIIMAEIEKMPQSMRDEIKVPESLMLYEAQGCKKCKSTGYIGRIALFEILEMTRDLGEIILKEPTESNIEKEARKQGMITMKQDGVLKVLDGVTSLEEVLRAAEI
jgi:type IV pilus assembly protein PilB